MDKEIVLCAELIEHNVCIVQVTVVQTKGSTPREEGARFWVSLEASVGTIGGGRLEYQATLFAQSLLRQTQQHTIQIKHFSLAAGLGMCCGGTVELMFELLDKTDLVWINAWLKCQIHQHPAFLVTYVSAQKCEKYIVYSQQLVHDDTLPMLVKQVLKQCLTNHKPCAWLKQGMDACYIERVLKPHNQLYLFGAGHVGTALTELMRELPWDVHWIDTRDDIVSPQFVKDLPAHIQFYSTNTPEAEVAQANKGAYFLVMTHDHALDLVLCEHILRRDDAHYVGMIGSDTKRKRFEHRLLAKGVQQKQLEKLICPIGIQGINSKQATAIAVSVLAQLLQWAELKIETSEYQETA